MKIDVKNFIKEFRFGPAEIGALVFALVVFGIAMDRWGKFS